MRDFYDSILAFIEAASLSDPEFDTCVSEVEALDLASYNDLLSVLDSRELVSNTRDRLGYYYMAAGVEISQSSAEATSNILVGGALCS